MRYFFHIGYKGSRYHGWQRQPNHECVQQVIESALSQVLKTASYATGCGRTDAGVHASQFFFHSDIVSNWNFDLVFRLNKILPPDIAVFEIMPMAAQNHARYDARLRTYNYFIHTSKNPFLNEISSFYQVPRLQLDRINNALQLVTKYTDFRAFCRTPAEY